jgi:heptosyltransferase-2
MQKILIIKMSALGDIFMALPHIEAIIRHHADDRIILMTGPGFDDLFANHPRLQVEVLDRKDTFGPLGKIGRSIWTYKQKFDVIYDLQGNRTSRTLVRFCGAAKRVGTQPRRVYNCHPETEYTRNTQQNVFDRLNETLIAAGIPPAEPRSLIYCSDRNRQAVDQFKQQYGLDSKPYILFHAGSSSEWSSKQWPRDNFIELAEMFTKQGILSIWVGGPEDREINEYLSNRCGIDATGFFSFTQLAELAGDALCAVTNDSGPMHIMAAANIPVYSFFGPTSWVRSHAVGQKERVFTGNAPCSPCFKGTCPPKQRHQCLTSITPKMVYDKINGQIGLENRRAA